MTMLAPTWEDYLSTHDEDAVDAALRQAAQHLQVALSRYYYRPVWGENDDEAGRRLFDMETAVAGARSGDTASLRTALGFPDRGDWVGPAIRPSPPKPKPRRARTWAPLPPPRSGATNWRTILAERAEARRRARGAR